MTEIEMRLQTADRVKALMLSFGTSNKSQISVLSQEFSNKIKSLVNEYSGKIEEAEQEAFTRAWKKERNLG